MPLFCYWIFGSVNLFAGYLVQHRQQHHILPTTNSTTAGATSTINHHHHHHHHHLHHHHHHLHHNQPLTAATHNNNTPSIVNGNHSSNRATSSILPRSVNGLGAFLFIYCIPSALLMFAVFYEFAHRDIWLTDPKPSAQPTVSAKAPMWPFMLRAFMELLVGVLASGWTLGPRFAAMWKSRMNCASAAAARHRAASGVGGATSSVKCKTTGVGAVKYPTTAYSTTSYQTVCGAAPQNSMVSIAKSVPKHGRKYPPAHVYRKSSSRTYKTSSQSISLTGNETVL